MKREWLTFVNHIEDLAEGRETKLTVKDLAPGTRKYDARIVRAILSKAPEKMPEGDTLWIRSFTGVLHPKPWGIKIIGEAGEYIPRPPYDELTVPGGLAPK